MKNHFDYVFSKQYGLITQVLELEYIIIILWSEYDQDAII